jgi:hypothetical protein
MQVRRGTYGPSALLWVVLVCSGTVACTDRGGLAFVTESPDRALRVEVVGNLTPSRNMFTSHLVEAEVVRASGERVVRAYLYEGGFLDDGFATVFGDPVWPEDHVLVFPTRAPGIRLVQDSVVLRNESGAAIRCARIRTRDLALMFDIPDGAERRIRLARHAGADIQGFSLMTWGDGRAPVVELVRVLDVPPANGVQLTVVLKRDRQVELQQAALQVD